MSTNVPRVDYSASVSEACNLMNRKKFSGAIVFRGDNAVGMITDRALLHRFVVLNKKPDEVKVSEVMAPLLKIGVEASSKEAAKELVKNNYSRLGVFEGDKCLGWVSLTDLAREASKNNLLDALLSHNEPEPKQVLCPKCRKAFLRKIMNMEGEVVRWQCTKCEYAL